MEFRVVRKNGHDVVKRVRFRYIHLWFWKNMLHWWYISFQWRRLLRRTLPGPWFVWYVIKTFEEGDEYGWKLPYTGRYQDKEKVDWHKEQLAKDIELYIPEDHRAKVEFRATIPTDYGRCKYITWYYYPNNKGSKSHEYLEYSKLGGFIWV